MIPFLAYLDPGTGSVVLQVVVGGVLGALVVIKLMWRRIVGFLTGRKPEAETPPAEGAGK